MNNTIKNMFSCFCNKQKGLPGTATPSACCLIFGVIQKHHTPLLTKVRWGKQRSLGVSLTNPQFLDKYHIHFHID